MGRTLLILTGLLLFLFKVESQENILTIQDAVESAFSNNAGLGQLRAALMQKENEWRLKTGFEVPEISYFKEGISSTPGGLFDEKRITVSQEIDFPLSTTFRLKGVSEELKALEMEVKAVENDIKAEVKSFYVEVLYAIYLQQSRQNQLRLAQELYNAVFTKFETGMANGIDLTNAELRLEEAKNDLDQSEWILHKARYGLFKSMGLDEKEQLYTIVFSDSLRAYEVQVSQIQALLAQKDHPRYLAAQHEVQAADFFLKEAKSNILPDLRLSLYKQNFGDGYDFRGFEVGLKVPLWFPFEQQGIINQASARKEEIIWKQTEIGLEIKKQIEYAWHNYDVSRSIINRYNNTLKDKAIHLQSLSLKAYQLGEIDLLNLLTAQQTYLTSEQRYLEALRDYYIQLVSLERYLERDLVY